MEIRTSRLCKTLSLLVFVSFLALLTTPAAIATEVSQSEVISPRVTDAIGIDGVTADGPGTGSLDPLPSFKLRPKGDPDDPDVVVDPDDGKMAFVGTMLHFLMNCISKSM